jgi:hypothetical protein
MSAQNIKVEMLAMIPVAVVVATGAAAVVEITVAAVADRVLSIHDPLQVDIRVRVLSGYQEHPLASST